MVPWGAQGKQDWVADQGKLTPPCKVNLRCYIYWGDIDTHGFAIVGQFRGHFDQVESFHSA